ALIFWGRLERTPYIAGGGRPLISGLAVTYEPRWIPRLYVGLGRYFVQPWGGLTLSKYLAVFEPFEANGLTSRFGPTGDNPRDNQLASVFARWVFPAVGLEIYGEWAREDYNWSWWGTIREPDRSQAYLVGLQKTFRAGSRLVRLHLELVDLQEMAGFGTAAGAPTYYVHGNDLGYTNRGQLIGAWIGPGADSQTLALDVFHAGGRIGGYLERVRRNDAYYWEVIQPVQGNWSHDAEITAGVRQALAVGPLEVTWEAAASYRQNRDFIRHEPNFKLVLGLSLPTGPPAARSP
ncbi:MAG TPA: capsule assembly Wzi family protein, partial [Anaeromyxobacter sp.]